MTLKELEEKIQAYRDAILKIRDDARSQAEATAQAAVGADNWVWSGDKIVGKFTGKVLATLQDSADNIKWLEAQIKEFEQQRYAVGIKEEYDALAKVAKREPLQDKRLDYLKSELDRPEVQAQLVKAGGQAKPGESTTEDDITLGVNTKTDTSAQQPPRPLTADEATRLKADMVAQGYDPAMVPYVQKPMEALLSDPRQTFESAYTAVVADLKQSGILQQAKKDASKPPIQMTEKDVAWIAPKLQEMNYSPNEIELVMQLIKDAMQSGEPLATSFAYAVNTYKPSGKPEQENFIGYQSGSAWVKNPKTGEWEFRPPPELAKENPPMFWVGGASQIWDPKQNRYVYTPPYISEEDKAKGKFELGTNGSYWEWDSKTNTPIYHAATKDPAESDSYFSDGSSWRWNEKTKQKEFISGPPVPLSPFQNAQIKSWDSDRAQQQSQFEATQKAAAEGRWLDAALRVGEMAATERANLQTWLTAKETNALEREKMISNLGPREWLKKTMLQTGGEPNPSQVPWLELLGADMKKAQELYEADEPGRQAEAEYRSEMAMDEAEYAANVGAYVNSLMNIANEYGRVPSWLWMVPQGANVATAQMPTPPTPAQARPKPVGQRVSWVNQLPIQQAGAETFLNKMTPTSQQQALGLWETRGENVRGYDEIPKGGMPASWTGILRGGLRTAPKVHR